MKITVKHKDTEIIVCENDNDTKDIVASMRWSDQNKQIQETIIVMTEQVKRLSYSSLNL
jgi:hypothetical protein